MSLLAEVFIFHQFSMKILKAIEGNMRIEVMFEVVANLTGDDKDAIEPGWLCCPR